MIKYTKHFLNKLEEFLEKQDYDVRYEKGNFHSGYCLVESNKVVVINKFFDTEGRINCLLEILGELNFLPEQLTPASAKFYRQINSRAEAEADEAEEAEEPIEAAEEPTEEAGSEPA